MASEALINYMRPGFPVVDKVEKGDRTRIEYVGPKGTLESGRPAYGASWGDYPGTVTSTSLAPQEGGTHAVLTVEVEQDYDVGESSGSSTARETTYEVEWMMASRSLYEHPVFAIGQGGSKMLTSEDVSAIEKWRNEESVANKKDFKYTTEGGTSTLSDNAKAFARGIQLGIETFDDYLPVVRKITTYTDYNPSTSSCGEKDNPPSSAGGPSGYEWRKSADRAVRAEGQRKWERQEEWIGAKKVMLDKDKIYWTVA